MSSSENTKVMKTVDVVHLLRELDQEYVRLEQQYESEVVALQNRFERVWLPILVKRKQHLSEKGEGDPLKATPAVPCFWLVVLKNAPIFQEDIEPHDEPVLEYLQDIYCTWKEFTGKQGFCLFFEFVENPYFRNTTIRKTYDTVEVSPFADDLNVTRITTTPIEWYNGKDVTVTQANCPEGAGRLRFSFFRTNFRTISDIGPLPSDLDFIHSFGGVELGDEEVDETDLIEVLVNDDYEKGCALRDSIVPHAVRFYTREAIPDESDFRSDPDSHSDDSVGNDDGYDNTTESDVFTEEE